MSHTYALPNYLLTHRKRLGYTQKQVAEALKCAENQIYRYESGNRVPDLKTAIKLELLYRTTLQRLFAGLYEEAQEQLGRQVQVRESSDAAPAFEKRSRGTRGRILALDPWTRAIGFAVLEEDELLNCGVRWLGPIPLPERLLVKGKSFVEELIEFYRPSVLVLSRTDYRESRRSRYVQNFCRAIKKVAEDKKLRLKEYEPREVKARLGGGGELNKHGLCLAIAERFSELAAKVPPPRKPWQSQDVRNSAFQAVGLALAVGSPASASQSSHP